jgi:UDP-N-acetylmuramyl pentapeptide synthase
VTPYVPADRVPGGPRALPGTAFVAYPYALRVACHTAGGATWLQVTQAPDTVLPPFQQQLGPTWGLHVADVTIALGDLVEAVRRQESGHR